MQTPIKPEVFEVFHWISDGTRILVEMDPELAVEIYRGPEFLIVLNGGFEAR